MISICGNHCGRYMQGKAGPGDFMMGEISIFSFRGWGGWGRIGMRYGGGGGGGGGTGEYRTGEHRTWGVLGRGKTELTPSKWISWLLQVLVSPDYQMNIEIYTANTIVSWPNNLRTENKTFQQRQRVNIFPNILNCSDINFLTGFGNH